MGAFTNLAILSLTLVSRVATRNVAAKSFVQLSSNPRSGPIPYCENDQWVSCEQVIVDLTALRSNQPLTLPNGDQVSLVDSSPGPDSGSTTSVYQSEDLLASMTITFFASGSNEANAIIYEDDQVFTLAPCDQTGGNCHVLAKGDPNVEDLQGGIPWDRQRLIFVGEHLDDGPIMSYCNIFNEPPYRWGLHRRDPHARSGMQIFIKTSTHRIVPLKMETYDFIEKAKCQIVVEKCKAFGIHTSAPSGSTTNEVSPYFLLMTKCFYSVCSSYFCKLSLPM